MVLKISTILKLKFILSTYALATCDTTQWHSHLQDVILLYSSHVDDRCMSVDDTYGTWLVIRHNLLVDFRYRWPGLADVRC